MQYVDEMYKEQRELNLPFSHSSKEETKASKEPT